jgi:hypothetical protein
MRSTSHRCLYRNANHVVSENSGLLPNLQVTRHIRWGERGDSNPPTPGTTTERTAAQQQLHLDFEVDDLDEAEARVLELGAAKPQFQLGGH